MWILAACAPGAAAAPDTPALTGSNPASPGTSLTPHIVGRADGIVTAKAKRAGRPNPRRAGRRDRLTLAGGSSSLVIDLFTNSDCTGPPVASGTPGELEGPGIAVTVAPDSITTFFASATDGTGTSGCSNPGLVYQQVTTGPSAPSVSGVSPLSPANDNHPLVSGSSGVGTTVYIHTTATCTDTAIGSGSAVAFGASGIQVTVPDDSTKTLYARATLAGINSPCSPTGVTYREDSTPPAPPDLRTVPGPRANENDPRVEGSAPGASIVRLFTSASCNGTPLASGTPSQLGAGFAVHVDDNTTTNFFAEATDAAGNTSICSPSPTRYVEDSVAPKTLITLGPGVKTRMRTVVFRFRDASGDPGTAFLCKLDRRRWAGCSTPRKFGRLRRGRHTVRIKAIDAAGNREARGAKRRFKVIRRR
ncbi:MAG: hypothetical protein U0R52_09335 [Solirubrobacterales bacterium]